MTRGGGPREPRPVAVTILGQPYTLRTEDDAGQVKALAAYVDGRMREVADRTRTADTVKIAILAALNIADDLHRLRRESESASREREARAGKIAALLDAALGGVP